MANNVWVIRFLAALTFCGSPAELEYCMPPRIIEMTAISPKAIDSVSIAGLTYFSIKSQLFVVQRELASEPQPANDGLAAQAAGSEHGALPSQADPAAGVGLWTTCEPLILAVAPPWHLKLARAPIVRSIMFLLPQFTVIIVTPAPSG